MTANLPAIFVEVKCPVCGGADLREMRPATYPTDITVEDLQESYTASSDHILMDRVVECRGCGMVFLSPRLEAGLIQYGYERWPIRCL